MVLPRRTATGEGDHEKHGGGGESSSAGGQHPPPPPPSAVPLPRFAGRTATPAPSLAASRRRMVQSETCDRRVPVDGVSFASIGECMIELSAGDGDFWKMG